MLQVKNLVMFLLIYVFFLFKIKIVMLPEFV